MTNSEDRRKNKNRNVSQQLFQMYDKQLSECLDRLSFQPIITQLEECQWFTSSDSGCYL